MASESLNAQVASLLASDGGEPSDVQLVPCNGGGNNRVFVVNAGNRKLIAKWYFSYPSDKRDRLRSEYAFLTYAVQTGITCVPRPLSCDPARNLALYEYIDGERISGEQITEREVNAALEFFSMLNKADARRQGVALSNASEACFSINEHLMLLDKRIEQLMTIVPDTEGNTEACVFAARLKASWQDIKATIINRALRSGLRLDELLPEQQRCISPSDFGFHNALRRPSGEVCFIDFEYAGWDDPAKMVGDFFSHPAVPVDHRFHDHFLTAAMSFCPETHGLQARAELLFPVFQTKWCCIILNEFLPDSARRRKFADPDFQESDRKRVQLSKAMTLFSSIQTH